MSHELGVDAAFTYAPRDQLRVLTAEVDDQDRPLLGRPLRKRDNLSLTAVDSSATPS
jgi:hypothetical protein